MPGTATTYYIDGTPTDGSDPWIDSLVFGGAWKDGDGGTVTIQWTAFQGTMDGENSMTWSPVALTALRGAMSLWESVANIDFVEVAGDANADVLFWQGTEGQAGGSNVLGWSEIPGYSEEEVLNVLFNGQASSWSAGGLAKGGNGFVTLVHEIGHLLGLAHPHDGGGLWFGNAFPGVDAEFFDYGDGELNQGIYTTMGYNSGWASANGPVSENWGFEAGPMALDVAAIQAIYGANTSYASGNNVYKLPTANGAGAYWSTIWDTGGIDTISNEGASGRSTIDLRAATGGIFGGGYLSYGYTSSGVVILGGYTIARGVVIENAIGGSGNDTLIGNSVVNRLEGGGGNDSLDGGAGADTMVGGTGSDTYYVDDSGDVIVEYNSGPDADTVYSSAANHTLSANVENLTLMGEASINGKGNDAANTITGNSGDNVVEGGGGADNLSGDAGNDRLVVADLAFQLVDGGTGTDTLVLGGANLGLDLSNLSVAARVKGIERIDLSGTGDNTLIVSQASLLDGVGTIDGDRHVLVVEGNSGDRVWLVEQSWTKTGSFTNADGTFDRWVLGDAEIHVEQGVSVQPKPASATILLSSLNGDNGFKLSSAAGNQNAGSSVASAGDVNGDGFDDLIVGDPRADSGAYDAGASYIVFGKASGFTANISLSTLNGSNGFKLSGLAAHDRSGHSVASAGDVNGDGFADLIIGASYADPNGSSSGASYIVFGKASGFAANLSFSTLNGSNGFRVIGAAPEHYTGEVASAGDFNNDGFDDLIVGGWGAETAYIVYGKASGFAATIDLDTLNANTGLRLFGGGEQTGRSVASAGDINGDGYDDVIVGAPLADMNGEWAGTSYVVFGRASGTLASIALDSLNGGDGFSLSGGASDQSGFSVASAGDVNGDGFADLIVGAPRNSSNGFYSGLAYVVFGKASGFAANIDLSALNGTNGFRLKGVSAEDIAGQSVASAGDFNGDGFADLIVGAPQADPTSAGAGATYVVFGKASGFAADIDLSTLDGINGFQIAGIDIYDMTGISVASAGDVNGDGYDDLVVGANQARPLGAAYVLFGGAFGGLSTPVTTTGTTAAEILIGGRGDDVLTGGGGGDVFHAGAGNDRMVVKDLAFRLVDGGGGTDTLAFGGAGLSLDLSKLLVAGKLEGIERIDLSGSGNNTLIVNQLGILGGIGAVADGKHILVVERNYGDTVQFTESNWTKTGSFTNADGTFDRWVLGNAEVHVEQVNAPPGTGAYIVGTAGDDIISTTVTVPGQLLATELGDFIDGRAGADSMTGGQGDDTYIVDNTGDRTVELVGGGIDWVRSSAATYTLGDNVENLELLAGAGQGYGNGLNNRITGNELDNVLDGGLGADTMVGGLGYDGYTVDDLGDVVIEAADAGHDEVRAFVSYTLSANIEDLRLMGAGAINGTGNELHNTLSGNSNANVLDGGAGADFMMGWAGNDTYIVDIGVDFIVENIGQGTDTVLASVNRGLGANIENLVLTGLANIDGYGNELANLLIGNVGNNLLFGGAGADTMSGGLGNDTYIVDDVGDIVTEGAGGGVDIVQSSITYTLLANVENLVLTGSGDINGTGNALKNVLTGNAGKNVLDGGLGGDTMTGGAGNDTYVVDNAGDVVVEVAGGGYDTVLSSISWTLGTSVEYLTLTGSANIDGTGNGVGNSLTGNAGNNRLDGGTGADKMAGGLGNDTYVVDAAGDVVTEGVGEGTDTVEAWLGWTLGANLERLRLMGTADIDGTGNGLANVLTGNAGKNVLDGGAGADTMTGGAGNDTYLVDNAGDVVIEVAGGGYDTVLASISWTLGTSVEYLTLTGTANIDGTGNTGGNTLTGNTGNNRLDGGVGADKMAGGSGNDTYVVDNAGDVVTEAAGEGTDTVEAWLGGTLGANLERLRLMGAADINGTGNALNNMLTGNAGKNVLDGGAGADTMTGGAGNDTYVVDNAGDVVVEVAGGGYDTVLASISWALGTSVEYLTLTGTANIDGTGNTGGNSLTGNAGNNRLDGGVGTDKMAGGSGNDTYVVDNAGDVVTEGVGEGTDTVNASISWALGANVEKLVLTGTGDINGSGNGLANVLFGNAGKNVLDGGAGADTMTGGAGNDTYVVDNVGDVAIEVAGGGYDTVLASISWTLGTSVEYLTLTGTANIDATGNSGGNTLTGNAGNNRLDGGAGADKMTGGAGNDTYVVDNAGDLVTEGVGEGTDTVEAWLGWTLGANLERLRLMGAADINGTGNGLANALTGNAGKNVLDGGAGADTMIGGLGDDTYVVDNAGDVVVEVAGGGIDTVLSSIGCTLVAGVEKLTLTGTANIDGTGNDLGNVLIGNAGNNVLDGGAGADTMTGGLGDDTYIIDNAGDLVTEAAGGGIDTVLSSISHTLRANVEKLVLTGNDAVNGTGNVGNNTLTGNDADNILDGGTGADTMAGGDGNDTYRVDNAGDGVTELANGGTDTVRASVSHALSANVENLTLLGQADIDATGNALANILTGNAGHNILDGGLGADRLSGGGGGDTFRFSTALGPDNVDRIVVFNHTNDAIQLDHAIFAALGTGALAAGAFNKGAVATQADDRILFDSASKSLYYDADGMGGAAAVKFATMDAVQGGVLDHTDFLIV